MYIACDAHDLLIWRFFWILLGFSYISERLRYRNSSSWRHHWSLASHKKRIPYRSIDILVQIATGVCLLRVRFLWRNTCNRRRLRWSGSKRLTWPSTRGSRRSTYETVCEVLSLKRWTKSTNSPPGGLFSRSSRAFRFKPITKGEKGVRAELMSAKVRLFGAREGPRSEWSGYRGCFR